MTNINISSSNISLFLASLIAVFVLSNPAFAQEDQCPEYAVYHTTTPQRPATSDKFLFSENLKALEPKDADVILLGDSLTQSWRSKDLQKKLPGLKVLNLGVGADRTQQVIWRLNQMNLKDYDPKFVVLWIGTNNLRTDPGCAISEGIIKILSILRDNWQDSKVIVIETPPRGIDFSAYMPQRLEMYDAAKEKYADQDVVFINVDDVLTCGGMRVFSDEYREQRKIYRKVASPCSTYKNDLLHLTKDAYVIISDILADIVLDK